MERRVTVVGAGIVGCVVSRELAEKGYRVTLLERRDHIAGNLYDYVDEHGILVHRYGPHIFHTENERVYRYINRFARWKPYKLVCGAVIDGICTPTAFNLRTVDQFFDARKAAQIKERLKAVFGEREAASVTELLDCADPLVREYAQFLYDKDYSLYTAKQWGIPPSQIDKSVLARVPVRLTYREEYFTDKYECLPENGYTDFIAKMLEHERISVRLGVDFLKEAKIGEREIVCEGETAPVVYTGAVDELFSAQYGRLPYRSLRFEWKYEEKEQFQDMPVVAYPQAPDFTRITEYKKLPPQKAEGTSYAVEYPLPYVPEQGAQPYYPVLTQGSGELYEKYAARARKIRNLTLAGRLADFKYYNMDQAIERALSAADELAGPPPQI